MVRGPESALFADIKRRCLPHPRRVQQWRLAPPHKGARSRGTMNWIPGARFDWRRESLVMNRSTPAAAAQANWMASGGRRERSERSAA